MLAARRFFSNWAVWFLALVVILIATLLPLYVMFKYSISDKASWVTGGNYPVPWWPFSPTLENFFYYLKDRRFWSNAGMSVQIAGLTVLLSIALGVPAAYSLTRFKFPAVGVLLFFIISIRTVPDVASAVPMARLFAGRVLGTLPVILKIALTHCLFGLPYIIFVTQGIFETIPKDLDEQAYMLGASRAYIFLRIITPLVVPGVAAAAIYVFILSWNEFLFAYFITATSPASTVPLAVYMKNIFGVSSPNPVQLSLISLIVSVPVLVFTFVIQKYIVAGATAGAVKQ
jgi:multiple sugar transport system permease protein